MNPHRQHCTRNIFYSDKSSDLQLKDENGQLVGVDASGLLVANSGNDLPVRTREH